MQVPTKTVEFLDAMKARRGLTSDYQLFKALGWKQTTLSSYRCGRTAMSGPHALKVADELGLPHAYVVACMQAERENNRDVARVWQSIAEHFRGAAASVLLALVLGVSLLGHAKTAAAAGFAALAPVSVSSRSLYILLNWLRGLAELLNPPPLLAA